MTTEPHGGDEVPHSRLGEGPTLMLQQLRAALGTDHPHGSKTRNQALNALIIEAIEDLIDVAMRRDRDDVGAIEIESTLGEWRVAIRLARDEGLHGHVCARGRARGWRSP